MLVFFHTRKLTFAPKNHNFHKRHSYTQFFMKFLSFPLLLLILSFASCKPDLVIVPDNTAPDYDKVPTIIVKNYINRLFIDLIGREPLDVEMDSLTEYLKSRDLSKKARLEIITSLQTDTTYREGDSSYFIAYHKHFYDLCKTRMIEGASNSELNRQINLLYFAYLKDSINGNIQGMKDKRILMERYHDVIRCEVQYRRKEIEVKDIFYRMAYNGIYDQINMNTFNFVNATFDDLFFRYPTRSEFSTAFDIIEYNRSSLFFGRPAQNKADYLDILTDSREFYEGLIIWTYKTLMGRAPDTEESYELMKDFYFDHDLLKVQQFIVSTDEYANFR